MSSLFRGIDGVTIILRRVVSLLGPGKVDVFSNSEDRKHRDSFFSHVVDTIEIHGHWMII